MGKLASIDFGKKRIGLAITDDNKVMALPLKVLQVLSMTDGAMKVTEALKEYNLDGIVIGLPLHMDGREGTRVQEVKYFKDLLKENFSCPFYFEDERLSSMEAESRLIDLDMKRKKRSKILDAVAAQVILQSYLESNH